MIKDALALNIRSVARATAPNRVVEKVDYSGYAHLFAEFTAAHHRERGELVGRDRDGRCVVNVSLPWTPSMSDVMAMASSKLSRSLHVINSNGEIPFPHDQ